MKAGAVALLLLCVQCVYSVRESNRVSKLLRNKKSEKPLSVKLTESLDLPQELFLGAPEYIKRAGFPLEIHHVETDDGYTLELHRIPHGADEQPSKGKVPVLVPNPLFTSGSTNWVFNERNQSLAFVLADAGYDVWLGNFRGTDYSFKHKKYTREQKQFWRYSLDDLGSYDLAAMIDCVIDKTGYKKIFMISAVLGTIPPWFLFSNRPEYNDKVISNIVLGPYIYLGPDRMTSIIEGSLPVMVPVFHLLDEHVRGDLYTSREAGKTLGRWLGYLFPDIISFYTLILNKGHDSFVFNTSKTIEYKTHYATGVCIRPVHQIAQSFRWREMRHFDFGTEGNMKHYGKPLPDKVDLTKISVPTFMMICKNDFLAGPSEADIIAREIQKPIKHIIDNEEWSLLHFYLATNAKTVVYDHVIDYMRRAVQEQ